MNLRTPRSSSPFHNKLCVWADGVACSGEPVLLLAMAVAPHEVLLQFA
jgi:hypothetical protein